MSDVIIHVDIPYDAISGALMSNMEYITKNEQNRIAIHQLLRKMCDPYVPIGETGLLRTQVEVTADYVRYFAGLGDGDSYAHYQYTGEVYGPNIPIMENGIIVGWWSPPGKGSKHPTGRKLTYSNPQATDHWDEAMMREHGDEFKQQVKDILVRGQGYG